MPTKFCPHCGERTGFGVKFNISCCINGREEKGYLRICKICGGRFITVREGETVLPGGKIPS